MINAVGSAPSLSGQSSRLAALIGPAGGGAKLSTRAYKFALRLSPTQGKAIGLISRDARNVWNTLVRLQRRALLRAENGDLGGLVNDYAKILAQKKPVGMACKGFPRIQRMTWFAGLSDGAQCDFLRRLRVRRQRRFLERFLDNEYSGIRRRELATAYAVDKCAVMYASGSLPLQSQLFHCVCGKFKDSSKLWHQFKRGQLRYKRWTDTVSLQAQAQPIPENNYIDLHWFHPVLIKTQVVQHRDLPPNSTVKQVALSVTPLRTFVILFVEAPSEVFEIDFKSKPGVVIGIDPGLKTALTWATPSGDRCGKIQPANSKRTPKFLRRLGRLQRRLDRQRRANNPEAFDDAGRWIKGKRANRVSHNMRGTLHEIARISGRLANRRTESYRLAARELLDRADIVKVGNWRPTIMGGDRTAQKRGIHRAGLDAAISSFVGILSDYAQRCDGKSVVAIREHGTTIECPDCHQMTGPKSNLKIREWQCSGCGAHHDRDTSSARVIAQRPCPAHSGLKGARVSVNKVRRLAKKARQTKASRNGQNPRRRTNNSRHGVSSTDVMKQASAGSRESHLPATQRYAKADGCAVTPSPEDTNGCSQITMLLIANQAVKIEPSQ